MVPSSIRPEPIWLSVFGVGLALLGLVWAALAGRLSARRRWAAGGAAACLACLLGAGAWAWEYDEWLWQPLLALAAVALAMPLASSRLTARLGSVLAALASRYRLQALVLVVGGAALAGSQLWQMERDLERDMDRTEADLKSADDAVHLHPTAVRQAHTDAGGAVPLFLPRPDYAGEVDPRFERRYLRAQRLGLKLIQTGPADPRYNCHGWIFAAGRYWMRSDVVERVLADNRYGKVDRPATGDVAIFRNEQGEVTHSALVRSIAGELVLLESKWGLLGRYVHTSNDHIYGWQPATYYRTPRGDHRLRGTEEPALTRAGAAE
jgi:hypothetical protein